MDDTTSDPRLEWAAKALVWAATVFMLCIGLWELAAPVGAGHFAVVGSRGIIADNMLTWGIITPVRSYVNSLPRGSDVYAHHPWGTFWLVACFRWLLGRHDFVPRIYPVLMNTLLPGMLYGLGRALWGSVPGALCALGWVVLPITLAFAQFPGFEVPVVFACVWASWAAVRFRQTGLRRWGLLAVAAFLFVPHTDWTAAFYIVGVLGLALVLLAFSRASTLTTSALKRTLRFWVVCAMGVALGLVFYVREFQELGQMNEWLHSAEFRASGNATPLALVLKARWYWLEVMFTQIGLFVMALGAVLLTVQLVLRRRFEDCLPLMLLGVSTFHYLHFKNGADVHIFWPQPYAAHFALSLGALAATLAGAARWAAPKVPRLVQHSGFSILGLGLGIGLLIIPDALRGLNYSRNSGGRFNEHGRLIHQDFDKTAALRFYAPRMPKQQRLSMDSSMNPTWAQEFAVAHPIVEVQLRKRASDRFRTFDSRFVDPEVIARTTQEGTVTIIGPYWFIDAQGTVGPVATYRFVEREPTWSEWAFKQAHDPMLRIEPDPFSAWEWRYHLQQATEPPPAPNPNDLEQIRVAHNYAVTTGDTAAMAKHRMALANGFTRTFDQALPNGNRLIGLRFVQGVLPKLELFFVAAGPSPTPQTFDVWSTSKGPAPFSWIAPDPIPRSQSLRFVLPPSLWKATMIYVCLCEIRKRPGPEHFEGAWAEQTPYALQRDPHSPVVTLLDLR
jgi:hypothetical protein